MLTYLSPHSLDAYYIECDPEMCINLLTLPTLLFVDMFMTYVCTIKALKNSTALKVKILLNSKLLYAKQHYLSKHVHYRKLISKNLN